MPSLLPISPGQRQTHEHPETRFQPGMSQTQGEKIPEGCGITASVGDQEGFLEEGVPEPVNCRRMANNS